MILSILYQTELERVKFVLRSYLRTRISKVLTLIWFYRTGECRVLILLTANYCLWYFFNFLDRTVVRVYSQWRTYKETTVKGRIALCWKVWIFHLIETYALCLSFKELYGISILTNRFRPFLVTLGRPDSTTKAVFCLPYHSHSSLRMKWSSVESSAWVCHQGKQDLYPQECFGIFC